MPKSPSQLSLTTLCPADSKTFAQKWPRTVERRWPRWNGLAMLGELRKEDLISFWLLFREMFFHSYEIKSIFATR